MAGKIVKRMRTAVGTKLGGSGAPAKPHLNKGPGQFGPKAAKRGKKLKRCALTEMARRMLDWFDGGPPPAEIPFGWLEK